MSADFALVRLFDRVLDLCNLRANETLAVLSEGGTEHEYAEAFLIAAMERGAHSFQVNVTKAAPSAAGGTKKTALSGNVGAVAALKCADMIVDLVGLLWSVEQRQLQNAGARILTCRESVENIRRMFPTVELRRRVETAASLLGSARTLRVTSASGTDVTYPLGQYPVITQYGYTDEPGRWDNLPGGFLYTGATDGTVEGTVVIDRGDLIFPFKRYLRDPIRLIIEGGVVTRLEGEHTDGELLRTYMEDYGDPRAYAVSHIGWGMDEKAKWDYLATNPVAAASSTGRDGRAYYGNVLFSTGPNSELGGTNDTGCHLDIPLRGCTLTLDGETIVQEGAIAPHALRAPGR